MKTTPIAACLFGLLSLVIVPARADVQFLGQTRSVSAENSQGGGSSASASGFDPFHGTAGVVWEYKAGQFPGDMDGLYSADAGQDSALLPYGITAQGYAYDQEPFFHYVDHTQSAGSDLHVAFRTDAATVFLVTGRLEAWGDYGGTDYGVYLAKVELSNDTGPLLSVSVNPATPLPPHYQVLDLYETFAVDPGVYTFDVHASADGCGGPYGSWPSGDELIPGCGGSGGAEYDVRLVAIPAPAVLPLALCGLGAVVLLERRRVLL
jgi:hypothetical protein